MITLFRCIKREAYFLSLSFSLLGCESQEEVRDVSAIYDGLKVQYVQQLDSTIHYMNRISEPVEKDEIAKCYFKARHFFKKAEPILSFADVENYETLNGPNLLQVEEEDLTDIKILEPQGFQVLEEMIFTSSLDLAAVKEKAHFVSRRLQLIKSTTNITDYKPYHFLWILRNSIIRTAFTGVTGFDSPILQQSLTEAKTVYTSLAESLFLFKPMFKNDSLYQAWEREINSTRTALSGSFEDFDRVAFIKNHTHHQFELWNRSVRDWEVTFPFELAIKNDAKDLFSPASYNMKFFSDNFSADITKETIDLGKKLFYDNSLSLDNSMSCASCHKPELAFTDGQKRSIGSKGKLLTRNAPTLTYAAFQKGFFYDKRAGNLEGQVISVVNDENEFHTDLDYITRAVRSNQEYAKAFQKIYQEEVTERHIRNALAIYIRSLAPFSSRFDRNIRGEEETLSEKELLGANLFMGKAACATCHFPPFFNGTVPPRFKETELESLGVPATAENMTLDTDKGRYNVFGTKEKSHFFKTSTVRNIELTAPYMHNGVYNTLEEVMHFYNVGGGQGMGFDVPLQTLPPDSLGLTDEEQQAIISFMHTLTDEPSALESNYMARQE